MTFAELYGPTTKSQGRRVNAAIGALGALEPGESVHIISDGSFSMEHLLAAVVDQIGPSQLTLSFWVIGTATVGKLADAMGAGLLTKIRYVVDPRGVKIRWEAIATLRKIARGIVAANHSKIMVIDSDSKSVIILSSANPNRNRRIESFTVITHGEVVDFYRGILDGMINGSDPFDAGTAQKECF